jgi:hypothetical protein
MRTAAVGDSPRFWRTPAVPSPPRHRECVAALRQRLADRGRRPGRRGLRRRCARLFDRLMPDVMKFLVQSRWVAVEARRQGIVVSERRVDRAFRRQKREAFPTERAYRRFLRSGGLIEAQVRFRVRMDLLQLELTRQVTRSVPREEQEAAVARFSREFRRRYRAQTRCVSGFVVRECGAPG